MSIYISSETEARLTDEARRQGISVDALLERLMTERAALCATQAEAVAHARELLPGPKVTPALPVLHLGAMGALHRRDIYDDVR
jgi:hypothetical protein